MAINTPTRMPKRSPTLDMLVDTINALSQNISEQIAALQADVYGHKLLIGQQPVGLVQ